MDTSLAVFQDKKIRKIWHNDEWWFSVVDIIAALTDSVDSKDYWYRMKKREKEDAQVELSTICRQLKLPSADGKFYETDCTNTEGAFRIIQSIPSPKAEPFKLWLAKVGYERVQEIENPELSVDRARGTWQKLGRSEKWIQQRMMGQETRNKLTDYWKDHDVTKEEEYAILTNIIHEEWTGLSVKDHKNLKGLKKQNLRDHMSEAELIFTALAELSTRQIAESENATGMPENKVTSKTGGGIAKDARLALEKKTRKKVVTKENYLPVKKRLK
ncbi:MAG: Bro-N domain-containing protein [Candidatus Woesearchaeota archaeon]